MDFPVQLLNQASNEEFDIQGSVRSIQTFFNLIWISVKEPSMHNEEIKFQAFLPLAKVW